MIFVTVGTHIESFERLIRKIDEIAPQIKEEIVIQKGFTKYTPKNVKFFDFDKSLEPYFKKARLVISHSATSILEFSLKYKKPLITVPRQKKYNEHLNDHQVEFALYFAKKTGIDAILDTNKITAQYLKSYKKVPDVDTKGLEKLQSYFIGLFSKLDKNEK